MAWDLSTGLFPNPPLLDCFHACPSTAFGRRLFIPDITSQDESVMIQPQALPEFVQIMHCVLMLSFQQQGILGQYGDAFPLCPCSPDIVGIRDVGATLQNGLWPLLASSLWTARLPACHHGHLIEKRAYKRFKRAVSCGGAVRYSLSESNVMRSMTTEL